MLKKTTLGKTGLEVTELCFGVLPMGPLQKNLPEDECISLLQYALQVGITFFDTAEMYKTQAYLGQALADYHGEVVIATKSTAQTYGEMQESVERSLVELRRDVMDIYHLHAARADSDVFQQREGALRCLHDYKAKGRIRAVGISTHNVKVVEAAAFREDIDVVYPLINKIGRGLLGGDVTGMVAAIAQAAARGKGVYAMKVLAGGHLLDDPTGAFAFVRAIPGNHAISVGMVRREELDYNYAYFAGKELPAHLDGAGHKQRKQLHISFFCTGCGTCVKTCPNGALTLDKGKAVVAVDRCILCGYCNPVCPEFAIRLV